ncbi:hypothetical protein GGI43DRAFT_386290 [Trichoderma evansii]
MDPEDYTSLDDIGQSEPLTLDLYHIENDRQSIESGSLKSYETKEGGSAVYAHQKSGYAITVERLLWVDGWEKTTINGEDDVHGQEMTLVVLKIVLASNDRKRKFARAEVSLAFEDPNAGGENKPTVLAWAPFHKTERWNASQAQHTKSDKKEGSVKLGYSGVDVSGGWSREGTVSWTQMAFDQGKANAQISRITQNRNGVTWSLEHNNIENAGVSQEFWKLFGLKPDKTKPFLVTSWKNIIYNYEGKDIKKCIDVNNLGKLVDPVVNSRLNVKWGPDYQIEVPMPSAGKQAWEREKMAEAE